MSGCDPEAVVSLATSRARGPPSDRAASRRAPRDRARPRRPPSAGRPDCRVIERLVSLTNYAEPPPASEPPAARAIRAVSGLAYGQAIIGRINTSMLRSIHKTIEGFWSILKRGIVGTFDEVSKKYLHLYVAEFQFRYNNRENPDIFGAAIKMC